MKDKYTYELTLMDSVTLDQVIGLAVEKAHKQLAFIKEQVERGESTKRDQEFWRGQYDRHVSLYNATQSDTADEHMSRIAEHEKDKEELIAEVGF